MFFFHRELIGIMNLFYTFHPCYVYVNEGEKERERENSIIIIVTIINVLKT